MKIKSSQVTRSFMYNSSSSHRNPGSPFYTRRVLRTNQDLSHRFTMSLIHPGPSHTSNPSHTQQQNQVPKRVWGRRVRGRAGSSGTTVHHRCARLHSWEKYCWDCYFIRLSRAINNGLFQSYSDFGLLGLSLWIRLTRDTFLGSLGKLLKLPRRRQAWRRHTVVQFPAARQITPVM